MEEKQVTVAILNWNSREMLARCIESVRQQSYPAIDLWVLDNASTDGSVTLVRELFPDLPLQVFSENLGFARAHNWAIRYSDSAYYMPLNPDVILMPDFVSEMVKAIEQQDRVGSAMGKLLFMTEDGQPTHLLYSTGQLITRSRAPANRGYKKQDCGQYEELEPVFAANGAAPLYDRAMLEDVRLEGEYFCEDYFIYGEDRDLGWRGQLCGWHCLYTPHAVAYHVGFGSGGIHSLDVQYQFTRNRYLTLIRNDRALDFVIDLPFVLAFELVWQLSRLVISPRRLLAHWLAFLGILRAAPRALRMRKQIQGRRRVPHNHIRSMFVSRLW